MNARGKIVRRLKVKAVVKPLDTELLTFKELRVSNEKPHGY